MSTLTSKDIHTVSQYLKTPKDFINIMCVCKNFRQTCLTFKYNPIPLDKLTFQIFSNIETLNFWNEKDFSKFLLQKEKPMLFKNFNLLFKTSYIRFVLENNNFVTHPTVTYSKKDREKYGLIIPQVVKSLSHNCFKDTNVTKVVLPQRIERLGDFCFFNCQILSEIVFNEKLTSIGNSCFSNAQILENAHLPTTIKFVGERCFENCYSLKRAWVPPHVFALKNHFFFGCVKLTKLVLPKSVSVFGESCFEKCVSLQRIVIPPKIKTIPKNCFKNCTSLTFVYIPQKVLSIEENAFKDCVHLKVVVIDAENLKIATSGFEGCEKADYYVEENECQTMIELENLNFTIFSNFKDIKIQLIQKIEKCRIFSDFQSKHEKIEKIENLQNLQNLENLEKSKFDDLFEIERSDRNIESPSLIEEDIDDNAMELFSKLVTPPNTKTKNQRIQRSYQTTQKTTNQQVDNFVNYNSLTAQLLINFKRSTELKKDEKVILESQEQKSDDLRVKEIKNVFQNDNNGSKVEQPNLLERLNLIESGQQKDLLNASKDKTRDSSSKNILVDKILALKINQWYANQTKIQSKDNTIHNTQIINVDENCCVQHQNGFETKQLDFQNQVDSVDCSEKNSYNEKDKQVEYKEIENTNEQKKLRQKEIEIQKLNEVPIKVPSRRIVRSDSFQQRSQILEDSKDDKDCICISKYNNNKSLVSPFLSPSVEKTTHPVIQSCSKKNQFTRKTLADIKNELWKSVDSQIMDKLSLQNKFGKRAFYNDLSISSVILRKCVAEIGEYCFGCCSNLTRVKITALITKLPPYTFYMCFLLNKILMPKSLTNIEEFCFAKCFSLFSVELPKHLNTLGKGCFSDCINLKSVNIPETVNVIEVSTFDGCETLSIVTLPLNIVEIPNKCFKNCYSLKEINLSHVKVIQKKCFENCYSIQNLNLENCEFIGEKAFSNCKELVLILDNKKHTIGDYCFENCKKITILNTILQSNDDKTCQEKSDIRKEEKIIIKHNKFDDEELLL
ncbi:hypothetical protein EIN_361320 [Entamoeba invadens IP1]|uniref:Leucine rich repeat containing protein BspA family protein n=1 Tax=Entamoeba invadens IP1 TaxID=370355 RepID=A0A0A1UDT6_ENTIV|nr:hypothetical protein EIN_361320 [Entamoeba invadens IP1]ELP90919.1 hypothetical protein EIN_361320 [Entamoeba invadens IP1]|eukprot:XP_004257690.1 hypothetical protein EIN_361320 [Entamoeba invadens IP1]